jgi:hypothetical protein
VENAEHAGASAVILYNNQLYNNQPYNDDNGLAANQGATGVGAFQARLTRPVKIPVVGMASHAVGADLNRQYADGKAPVVHLDIRTRQKSGTDFNLIADSPFGDPNQVVVIDAHLDSIFGAGILDNASGWRRLRRATSSATSGLVARKLGCSAPATTPRT